MRSTFSGKMTNSLSDRLSMRHSRVTKEEKLKNEVGHRREVRLRQADDTVVRHRGCSKPWEWVQFASGLSEDPSVCSCCN